MIEESDSAQEGRAKIPYLGKASEQAAEMVGASPRYVSDAKRVKEEAPEAFEGLRAGTVTMREARVIAAAPHATTTATASDANNGATSEAYWQR